MEKIGIGSNLKFGLSLQWFATPQTRPSERDLFRIGHPKKRDFATPLRFGCSFGSAILPKHLLFLQDESGGLGGT